jgi:hypothetical protein
MTAVNEINKNFLSPLGYKFTLARAPALTYNVQNIRFPGVQMSNGESPTPFVPIPVTGKLTYSPLDLTFRVNEDMTDYLEIYNWMVALASPVNFEAYKALKDQNAGAIENLRSDLNLQIMNSSMNSNIMITFYDAFPVSIGDMEFNSTDTSVNYIECSVEFKYLRYDISKIG